MEIETPGWRVVSEDESSVEGHEREEEEEEEEDITDEKYEEYYEQVRASILAMKAIEDEAKEAAELTRGTERKRLCVDPNAGTGAGACVSPNDVLTIRFCEKK